MRTLWDLQGLDMRKPHEELACVAPGIGALQPTRSVAPSTAPGRTRAPLQSSEKRCEQVLTRLLHDSNHWGSVQERQARLLDTNRDITHHSQSVRRDCHREHAMSADLLSQTFGGSQDSCRSIKTTGSFVSSIPAPIQSTSQHAYGLENAHRLAKLRGIAKTANGYEKTRAITMWGGGM